MNTTEKIERLIKVREELKPLTEEYDKLKAWAKQYLIEKNQKGIKTNHGSIGKSERKIATITNLEDFLDYAMTNDAIYLLNIKPASQAVKEWTESIEPIPGISFIDISVLNIRKSK